MRRKYDNINTAGKPRGWYDQPLHSRLKCRPGDCLSQCLAVSLLFCLPIASCQVKIRKMQYLQRWRIRQVQHFLQNKIKRNTSLWKHRPRRPVGTIGFSISFGGDCCGGRAEAKRRNQVPNIPPSALQYSADCGKSIWPGHPLWRSSAEYAPSPRDSGRGGCTIQNGKPIVELSMFGRHCFFCNNLPHTMKISPRRDSTYRPI
jgi:hypothetical protein